MIPRRLVLGLLAVVAATFASASLQAADAPSTKWPFTPLCRPAMPEIKQGDGVRNPIDRFVRARLEQAKLAPNPPADKIVLLRRVTYDLTGLAPTLAERDAFLHDQSPEAYEHVVDRFLSSPHFGERWAQHWLDIVRFAETEGYKVDRFRDDAYRYRDHVIRAFNDNMPFDRFLSQQIAGDELEPDNPDAAVAMGFWRLHMEESNGSNYRRIRQDILDDNTDVFASVFFGLTFSCARCHNHKFDPITQKDYYSLQAFITPLIQRDNVPLVSKEEQARYAKQLANWERETKSWRDQVEKMVEKHAKDIFAEQIVALDRETQTAILTPESKRTPEQKQMAVLASKQLFMRQSKAFRRLTPEQRVIFDDLRKKIVDLDALKPAPLPVAMSAVDVGPEVPVTRLLGGGNYLRPREEVSPDFPVFLTTEKPRIVRPAARPESTGRRSALAHWLTRPDHPLTARVIANRVWQRYLGKGIVGSPNDFGAQGEKPTHPELLDFLASELVRQDWKLKSLHRMIVTSATYMQSSSPELNTAEAAAHRVDPRNSLLWHARSRRRDAESLRDVSLQVGGRLNTRMYGPSAQPELPMPVSESRYAWYPDAREEDRNRRSIYVVVRRNLLYPLFTAFDAPDRLSSCPERAVTTSPLQALAMLDSKFAMNQAESMASALLEKHGSNVLTLIRQAYLLAYSREPTADEVGSAQRFLDRQARLTLPGNPGPMPDPPVQNVRPALASAFVDLCHALMNSVEFLYVD